MKIPTFCLSFINQKGKLQILSTKRMKNINKFLPTYDILKVHYNMEFDLLKHDKSYRPKPYTIYLKEEDYNLVLNDIHEKKKSWNGRIYLILQTSKIPIVMILKK